MLLRNITREYAPSFGAAALRFCNSGSLGLTLFFNNRAPKSSNLLRSSKYTRPKGLKFPRSLSKLSVLVLSASAFTGVRKLEGSKGEGFKLQRLV